MNTPITKAELHDLRLKNQGRGMLVTHKFPNRFQRRAELKPDKFHKNTRSCHQTVSSFGRWYRKRQDLQEWKTEPVSKKIHSQINSMLKKGRNMREVIEIIEAEHGLNLTSPKREGTGGKTKFIFRNKVEVVGSKTIEHYIPATSKTKSL